MKNVKAKMHNRLSNISFKPRIIHPLTIKSFFANHKSTSSSLMDNCLHIQSVMFANKNLSIGKHNSERAIILKKNTLDKLKIDTPSTKKALKQSVFTFGNLSVKSKDLKREYPTPGLRTQFSLESTKEYLNEVHMGKTNFSMLPFLGRSSSGLYVNTQRMQTENLIVLERKQEIKGRRHRNRALLKLAFNKN